jgi:hypothetical protein
VHGVADPPCFFVLLIFGQVVTNFGGGHHGWWAGKRTGQAKKMGGDTRCLLLAGTRPGGIGWWCAFACCFRSSLPECTVNRDKGGEKETIARAGQTARAMTDACKSKIVHGPDGREPDAVLL